ncbi:insulin-like growth factor-binding protein complex acid labile subunit, partial [Penaeus japonicus]|uniref:insulin-like growth factor-binding protein complex acid labile subunit n=1 Tax=Penaeus japonicus TaxID=27405 RepID=UPI001C7149F2
MDGSCLAKRLPSEEFGCRHGARSRKTAVVVWVAVALGCLLPPRPCAGSVHSSFGDNSGMMTGENTNVDYDAMTETIVRLATDTTRFTSSATLPPYLAPARLHHLVDGHHCARHLGASGVRGRARCGVHSSCSKRRLAWARRRWIWAPLRWARRAPWSESRHGSAGKWAWWAPFLTGHPPSSISTSGTLSLAPGWSAFATELWMRATGGLEHKGDLCAIMPPTLRFLDASRTLLGELVVGSSCAPLRRVEAAHSSLTRVSLCTPALVTLHVSGNDVAGGLEWEACAGGVAAVELLQANHNELTSASTCGWPGLHTLDVRHNRLESLDLTTCPPRNLTRVTAARNLLQTPPELTPTLLHVDLSRNSLAELPALTSALLTADFSHNGIVEVGKHRFKQARKLLHLKLAHNHLTQLHAHDLIGLRELRMLDVSYNRLREVSAGSFRHLRHLQRLHLQHNHLTTIDARDLAALTPRTHAIVHHNPWACTCSLLKSLQQLQNCAVCQHQV